jgi:hypothetical protein
MDPARASTTFNFLDVLKQGFESTFNEFSASNSETSLKNTIPFYLKQEILEVKHDLSTKLRNDHEKEWEEILKFNEMPKIMFLASDLIDPLARMIPVSKLKALGVQFFYSLSDANIDPAINFKKNNYHFIYLVRSNIQHISDLTYLLSIFPCDNEKSLHTIYVMPRISLKLISDLEYNGLLNKITRVHEYISNIFPINDDLLSLELKDSFKDLSDKTPLLNMAYAISSIEKKCGKIPNIYCTGKESRQVLKYLSKLPLEDLKSNPTASFASLVVIGREDDPYSPLLTPFTYEAMIREFIGISKHNCIQIEKNLISLDNETPLYLKLKSSHISHVPAILQEELEEINRINQKTTDFVNAKKPTSEQITEMSHLPKELGARWRAYKNHLCITEILEKKFNDSKFQKLLEQEQNILNCVNQKETFQFIQELIDKSEPLVEVLKILSLFVQVYGTLPVSISKSLCTDIRQSYGLPYYFTLREHLDKLIKFDFPKIRKEFQLIKKFEPTNLLHNKNIARVHNGYVPLSYRLTKVFLASKQQFPSGGLRLIAFPGGCTYSEITALRADPKIVVLTSEILTTSSFIHSLYGINNHLT